MLDKATDSPPSGGLFFFLGDLAIRENRLQHSWVPRGEGYPCLFLTSESELLRHLSPYT